MQSLFPTFQYSREKSLWRGPLQPSESSSLYTIEIEYKPGKRPVVRVLHPNLDATAPHRYPDGSLCLYLPGDESWHSRKLLARTIVPWAAEWLLYYECWCNDPEHRWLGPEAPHSGPKRAGS
jgi:hypothetical protein